MIRDPFGFGRLYYAPSTGRHAPFVRELLDGQASRALDRFSVAGHLVDRIPTDRSMFAAVRAVPPGHELVFEDEAWTTRPVALLPRSGVLTELLRAAIAAVLREAPRPIAVALSGGLDSALILALVHEVDPSVPALVLDPRLADYSEREIALETARAVGADAIVSAVTADELLAAVPEAIAAMEVPLFNLHPVAKWLLALAARRAGFATLLSGDGVDQVMTRDASANYLPLVSAAFARAGVALRAPLLDDGVVRHLLSLPPDPSKTALRAFAATLPIPRALVTERKVSRLAPPLDLSALVAPKRIDELARHLDLAPPSLATDRDRVRWTTLALLCDAYGAG
jgi:hypothetical protein